MTRWFCVLATFASILQPAILHATTTFSVDAPSAQVVTGTLNNSDVHQRAPAIGLAPPGTSPPPPVVVTPAAALGLLGVPADELDALSYGNPVVGTLFFSVDAFAVGVPGVAPDVASESAAAQVEGDVYSTNFGGTNTLYRNQSQISLLPQVPPGLANTGVTDEVNALDLTVPTASPVFSVGPGTAFGPADVLARGPAVAIPAATLWLRANDDIDALHLDTFTGDLYFSLTPASPSLLEPNPGCPAPPCSGADIFLASGGVGPFVRIASAAMLGLLASDNVDGMAWAGDFDLDGITDDADNCLMLQNPAQIDFDGDGCGNRCDADYDQTGFVGGVDFTIFAGAWLTINPLVDCDGDGFVGPIDFACFASQCGGPPGPGLLCP